MMIQHINSTDTVVRSKIRHSEITIGGNLKLKIYGTLRCASGKRLNRENRVFFISCKEAVEKGFRPCGHCMKPEYKIWKDGLI